MNFDELKTCSRCGSDACYSQEVTADVKIEMCYGCGFQSTSIMTVGSKMLEEQIHVLPEIYKVLIDEEEETGKVWIPSSINIDDKGLIYANGSDRDNWAWHAVKSFKTSREWRRSNPKFKDKQYHTNLKDVKLFAPNDFIGALTHIGVLPE